MRMLQFKTLISKDGQLLRKKLVLICTTSILLILGLAVIIPFFIFSSNALKLNDQTVAAYETHLSTWLTRYSEEFTNFDNSVNSSHTSPTLWRQEIHKQLDDLKLIDNDIRAYQPSFLVSTWHTGLVTEVADRYDRFADLYSAGLDNNDASNLQKADLIRKAADEYRLKFQELLK